MRIAVDVMGGDYAPAEIIAGAIKWLNNSDSSLLLVGNEEAIIGELEHYTYNKEQIKIVHAPEVIAMNESPALALRKKKNSSIVVATQMVKEKKADALISCGNTGAQMAAAIFILGRFKNIERPPIVASVPNMAGSFSQLIDVGANVDCRPRQLVQFAFLGKAYSQVVLDIENPRIGLLNNGEEESKGNVVAVETYSLLKKQSGLNFIGNIEGRDLFTGKCNVIICDGFTGNILLKTVEGMAAFCAQMIKSEVNQPLNLLKNFDYTSVGGAPLLGVEGISIVCHGSSRREAVFNGIRMASECIEKDMVKTQKAALSQLTDLE